VIATSSYAITRPRWSTPVRVVQKEDGWYFRADALRGKIERGPYPDDLP